MYESQPEQKGTLRNQITNIFGNSKDSTQTNSARALEQNRVNTKPVLKIKPLSSELEPEDNDDDYEMTPITGILKDKSVIKKFERKETGTGHGHHQDRNIAFTLKKLIVADKNTDRPSKKVEG